MSRKQVRMSECSGAAATVVLEAPGVAGPPGVAEESPPRCLWPRQQTWLCVVPLLIGCVGLGLSLMLLRWIVVGTVRDFVPTDLVDANRIGHDPIFLSKPSTPPRGPATASPATLGPATPPVTMARGRTRSPSTTSGPRGGGASQNGRGPQMQTTTTVGPQTSSPSPPNPTVLHDSTQLWTHSSTRTHARQKTPTAPPLGSEHYQACQQRDLTYCLNQGECFVIETLSGPHKHCKCKEGYQGVRCDQFLPKTDSVLSDPNHLGIEFMESREVYKRQVLSIISIAMAISLLGALCMALYCRNKRRREKFYLSESLSLKTDVNKTKISTNLLHTHTHKCKCPSQPSGGAVCPTTQTLCSTTNPEKHLRPDQKVWPAHWSSARRTPPLTRGRLNPIAGSKYSGPAYQHLQEVETSETKAEPLGKRHDGRFDQSEESPPPFCSSVPIIPSVQCCHDDDASCMQTGFVPMATATPSAHLAPPLPRDDAIGRLLEGAGLQLRALAHRKQEDGGTPCVARETVCFLSPGPVCSVAGQSQRSV